MVPIYDCREGTEKAENSFLRCPFYVTGTQQLLNNLYERHLSLQND